MAKTSKSFICCFVAFVCLSFSSQVLAADLAAVINTAGMQRMLSQKIAKAYFFLGENVRARKARKQLKESIEQFRLNHQVLKADVTDPVALEMLFFVDARLDEYAEIAHTKYSLENAADMLALSDTLLEMSQKIVKRIETVANVEKVAVVNLSGRQRMLSQRIAKFYIAYQAGFREQSLVAQLQQAVKQFEDAHKILMAEKRNTPPITQELERVNGLWKVVRGFFLDIEKGGLPVTVFSTTDKILERMNKVTAMYAKIVRSANNNGAPAGN